MSDMDDFFESFRDNDDPNAPINLPSVTPKNRDTGGGNASWDGDDALASLVEERSLHNGESNKQTAKRLIDENVPLAVMSIVNVALFSPSERARLDASKYLVDRALGRIGDEKVDEKDNPLARFLDDVAEHANS